jgi:hypothetical protein
MCLTFNVLTAGDDSIHLHTQASFVVPLTTRVQILVVQVHVIDYHPKKTLISFGENCLIFVIKNILLFLLLTNWCL